MGKTTIEWTRGDDGSAGETWNPVTGCTKVSDGCDVCYAEKITERFHGKGSFAQVQLHPKRLDAPLRWRKPRRCFVNSMSDLFHDQVPDEFIARVWTLMALTHQHTYQILTKRHGRMRSLLSSKRWAEKLVPAALRWVLDNVSGPMPAGGLDVADKWVTRRWRDEMLAPLDNVWLGVSVEDQKRADLRIPALLDTPAAVRFVSAEPLLGPVDLGEWLQPTCDDNPEGLHPQDCCGGIDGLPPESLIDWVICGGESGTEARPMHPDWARALRDDCRAARVPYFFKQWGAWAPAKPGGWYSRTVLLRRDGTSYSPVEGQESAGDAYLYASRSKSLRELDGRTWDAMPAGGAPGAGAAR